MTSTITASATGVVTVTTPNTTGTAWEAPPNGIVGGYTGGNVIIIRAMTAFTAIAYVALFAFGSVKRGYCFSRQYLICGRRWYNAIEIVVLVLLRFKKRSTLYFWSLIITSVAVVFYQFGAWGKMLRISNDNLLTTTFLNVGWIFMVAGQSIVLYSRLHLITQSRLVLNGVLWMIIINTVVLYSVTTAFTYGANVHPDEEHYVDGYNVVERVQMTLFTVQELIISGIYLMEAARYLKTVMEPQTRRLMYELVAVNILLIALDAALLGVEYESLYQIETTLKGMVYSIKLKLELAVLSKLVQVLKTRRESFVVTNPDDFDLKRFASAQVNNTILTPTSNGFPNGAAHKPSMSAARRTFSLARQSSRGTYRTQYTHQDEDTTAIDFANFHNGPLSGPSEEEEGYVPFPELIHRPSSRASSITRMYPGRISAEKKEDDQG